MLDPQTIVVADATQGEHVVRLAGIVGPPPKHSLYKRSKKKLESLILGKMVTVEWEKQEGNCDGRQIAERCRKFGKVLLDITDINLEMIATGLAKHDQAWRDSQSTPDRTQYTEAEEKARLQKMGLWFEGRAPAAKKKKKKRRN